MESDMQVFYRRYNWFRQFYKDLNCLMCRMDLEVAAPGLEYSRKEIVSELGDLTPSYMLSGFYTLPDPIVRYYVRTKAPPYLSMSAVLSSVASQCRSRSLQGRATVLIEVIKTEPLKSALCKPSLVLIVHGAMPGDDAWPRAALKNKSTKCSILSCEPKDGRFHGSMEVVFKKKGAPETREEVEFACFVVSLDEFSANEIRSQDELAGKLKSKVVAPLKDVLRKDFPSTT